jgi:hypothetical protein
MTRQALTLSPQKISTRITTVSGMKGDFSDSTFTKRRYSGVQVQQGRVQLDADWNEKLDLRVHKDIVYLEVWEREVRATEDDSLESVAAGGPDTSARGGKRKESEEWCMRLTREVAKTGSASSNVQFALGSVDLAPRRNLFLPESEVSVDGVLWRRVGSFSDAGPTDMVYVLNQDNDQSGSCRIEFGDGEHGARPARGARVTVGYRLEGGRDGNMP